MTRSARLRLALAAAAVATTAVCAWVPAANALLTLQFVSAPALPALTTVTLNAKSQTTKTTMTNFSVEDTRVLKSGWNVTVQGASGPGKSAVFAQYCPKAKCGATAEGYVGAGFTLPAGSLVLNSTGASLTGGTGSTPSFQCGSGCNVDSATAVKVVSGPSGLTASEGTWSTTGFSSSSLALKTAASLRALPSEEVYRVNILWTLSSGP
jgi:hypothetical protein